MIFSAPVTEIGHSVDKVALTLTIVSTLLIGFVLSLLVYFCVRYRRGSKASRKGRVGSSILVEALNASTILVFGLVIFVWAATLYYREYTAPKNSLEVYVIGKQWMWMFELAGGPRQIGRLKVPVNRPVRLLLSSDDVIHSFYVPAFRLKQDAVPGRYSSLWFEAKETGEYPVLCSEFCGTAHSSMRATIEVVSQEEFDRYQKTVVPAQPEGEKIYRQFACASCHETGGKSAPLLGGLFGRQVQLESGKTVLADENYLRRALVDPAAEVVKGYPAVMPTYRGSLSAADLAALLAYVKSLPPEVRR